MRSFSFVAPIARNVADANSGVPAEALASANELAAAATIAAAADALPIVVAAKPDTAKSNIAVKPARKPRKLSGNAVKPAADKPAATAKADKPAAERAPVELHGSSSYNGASPVFRGHGRKLSPIVLNRIPGTYSDRDHAALKALHAQYGAKPFDRRDGDAGVFSRLIGHGALRHVSGSLDMRDAKFVITAAAIKNRL